MRIQKYFIDYLYEKRDHFDIVMFDIDGTLIRGNRVLPRAEQVIQQLKNEAFPFVLLTNDGSRSPQQKADSLRSIGIHVDGDDIVSCAETIIHYVREHGYTGRKVFIMGDLGTPCYAERAKLRTTRILSELPSCDGVIVGEANYEWESTFNGVVNFFIRKRDAFILVPNPDTYWPTNGAEINIGAGGKARFLVNVLKDYGILIKPVYLGKPNSLIFQYAVNHLCIHYQLYPKPLPTRILHVGDSLSSDVQGARTMNFTSALLLTGITTKDHVKKLESRPSNFPDLIFEML